MHGGVSKLLGSTLNGLQLSVEFVQFARLQWKSDHTADSSLVILDSKNSKYFESFGVQFRSTVMNLSESDFPGALCG